MITTLTPVPPCQIRTQNHQSHNKKVWRSKGWRAARTEHLKQHPLCVYCQSPAITVHHPTDEDYGTDEYQKLRDGESVCQSCHWYVHHGYIRCECGQGWRLLGAEWCKHCRPVELKELAEIRRIKRNKAKREWRKTQYRRAKRIHERMKKGVRK
jgi:hypothetical protein